MTIKGARIPPKRAHTVTRPMADGLRVVGKISELYKKHFLFKIQFVVEPVNVNNSKAGCKAELAQKSK